MQLNHKSSKKTAIRSTGFTILELMIIVVVIGIVFAIASPSWFNFIERQRLNTAQNKLYQALQSAKNNSTKEKMIWQASIRENAGILQWAVHTAKSGIFIPPGVQWNNLDPNIQVSKNANAKGKCETTFDQPTQKCPTKGPWRVQFNPIGNTNGQLGQITLISKNGSKYQRCVYVSTLIGGIKTGKEHSKPNSSKKYCY